MAKSARASTTKRNNANLRKKVFGPAHDARTERLSARLQELAAAPKPESEKPTELHTEHTDKDEQADENKSADVDMANTPAVLRSRSKSSSNKITKKKKVPRKAKHSMVFASDTARKRRQSKSRRT